MVLQADLPLCHFPIPKVGTKRDVMDSFVGMTGYAGINIKMSFPQASSGNPQIRKGLMHVRE
jgi:hypothetical protein